MSEHYSGFVPSECFLKEHSYNRILSVMPDMAPFRTSESLLDWVELNNSKNWEEHASRLMLLCKVTKGMPLGAIRDSFPRFEVVPYFSQKDADVQSLFMAVNRQDREDIVDRNGVANFAVSRIKKGLSLVGAAYENFPLLASQSLSLIKSNKLKFSIGMQRGEIKEVMKLFGWSDALCASYEGSEFDTENNRCFYVIRDKNNEVKAATLYENGELTETSNPSGIKGLASSVLIYALSDLKVRRGISYTYADVKPEFISSVMSSGFLVCCFAKNVAYFSSSDVLLSHASIFDGKNMVTSQLQFEGANSLKSFVRMESDPRLITPEIARVYLSGF